MASVTFDRVTKVFDGDVAALSDFSLEVRDGEFVVLVGPSGCGKTTALRMVAGLEEITSGEILIGERSVTDVDSRERDVAMVFQNYALYPHMTVYDNIAFGLQARRVPRAEIRQRVEQAARALGLGALLRRKPRQLSGGQRQRVAMGRAIVRSPSVFLMDEPLSNLDARLRVQMRAEVARIQHELDATTIYVTHDQVEAMTMGDRVAVMSGGELQQVDSPQRLFEHPENLFVAGFIGTPPMNLIQAGVRAENGTVMLAVGDQRLPLAEEALARYPGVRGYDGRQVVLGVRSDDLHPIRNRPELPTLTATLELLEALGSQSMAYFRVDAETMRTDADDLEEELEQPDAEGVTAARPNLVATFSARDALGLKVADEIPLGVDVAQVHVFDAETGVPLR
jgi:multiple sugar transport system ATP-binding protein